MLNICVFIFSYFQNQNMAYYGNSYPNQPTGLGLDCCGGSGTCCLVINAATQIILGLIAIALGVAIIESGPLGLHVEQIYIPIWGGNVVRILVLIIIRLLLKVDIILRD